MRALVTGGGGYIGSHLVNALRQEGHAVRVLDLQPASGECCGDFVQGSIADPDLVAKAVQDIEVVYHLAWSFRAWRFYPACHPKEERVEMQENLFGTLNLLEAALAAKVRHFLFSGSAVVYGPTGPARVDEESPCHLEQTTLGGPAYGITKLACEKLCLVYQRRGLPVTIFRLHGVFSQENRGRFGAMLQQARAGKPVRATEGAGGEYAYLEDVVQAFLAASGNPKAFGEVFNLAGTHTYDEPELARYIVELAGSKSEIELVKDPSQKMISVSVDKLRRVLEYEPRREEFLGELIRHAV